MRQSVREFRAGRFAGIPTGFGCHYCQRQDVASSDLCDRGGVILCGRCRRELAPTPLDLALDTLEMTPAQFAEATGLAVRTVIRATKGQRMSKRIARKLGAILKMDPATFRPETKP